MTSFPYAFSRGKDPTQEFSRVLGRISARLGQLNKRRSHDETETVHEVRTLIKLLRALSWLAKPVLTGKIFTEVKGRLRNAASLLAERRDRAVIQSTLKALGEKASRPREKRSIQRASSLLASAPKAAAPDGKLAESVRLTQMAIRTLRRSVSPLSHKNASHRLDKAFRLTKRARRKAFRTPTPVRFHEWRKKAKRLWYLLELLQGSQPGGKARTLKWIEKLQHHLGDYHDSVVLEERLATSSPGDRELKPLRQLLAQQKRHLLKKSRHATKRLT